MIPVDSRDRFLGEKTAAAANSILASAAMDDALTVTDGGRDERRIQSSFLSPFLPRFAVFFHCLAVAAVEAVAVPPPWPAITHIPVVFIEVANQPINPTFKLRLWTLN